MKENLDLNNSELVALFGYRTLGFLKNKDDKREERWSANPWVFDNNYFFELLKKDSNYIKTPSDKVLLGEAEYLEYVEKFKEDQELFFSEFKKVYEKVSNLGYGEKELFSEAYNTEEDRTENYEKSLI